MASDAATAELNTITYTILWVLLMLLILLMLILLIILILLGSLDAATAELLIPILILPVGSY